MMPEPILPSLALGVAGNLATNVVQALGERIEDTRVGRSLSKLGLIKPGFEQRLRGTLTKATASFIENNPTYAIPQIFSFLESKSFSRDIRAMLLEQRGLDVVQAMNRLETYVGIPISEAPDSWPNYIDPKAFVESLFNHISIELGRQADPAILWIGEAVAHQGLLLRSISSKLDLLLDGGPLTHTAAPDRNADFTRAYLDHLTSRAQRVSTPGARELRGINQSLSVAYISLNLKSASGTEAIRAEEFLSKHTHVAIRGPAGSGKTTLLNWMITRCRAGRDEEGSPWGIYVPFFIPLRKVARLHPGSPVLDRLVEYSVDNKLWTHETPSGWITDIISKQKRAILMIDGVDELPSSRRVEFWEWLDDFISDYPDSRVIVTSRALPGSSTPGLLNEQWNPPKAFIDAQLQDMSDSDVTNFIHHWHDSIDRSKLDEQELTSLAEARASLPSKLEDAANRRIRELCNTPLLCAMICVLHWKEEGYLPRQRVEVYERCCDMLIEARDLKRGVQAPPGPISAMSKSDKEMVLQQLAIEMMHNRDDTDAAADDSYRIEISREKALAWIEPRIPRFQNSDARQATAEQVLDYLVERTGLLREPAKDLIDFPHRTFQEYLAACAAGADSQEGMLALQVQDDQWHETIMLAAGTNTGGVSFGRKLIDNLIRRGERHQSLKERSQRIRKTCFALALGCLENLRQQDEELRDSVLSHLEELVPPRSDGDARILSVAGDSAVAHLSYDKWKDENTATVSACARALRLIGTVEALKAMGRGYVTDVRQPVISEVCRSGAFSYETLPLVMSYVQATGRLPHFAETNEIALITSLPGLKEISIDVSEAKGLEQVGELTDALSLSFSRVNEKSYFLHYLPKSVEALYLSGSSLPDGNWITPLDRLKSISLEGVKNYDVLRIIDAAPSLQSLAITASDFDKLDQLRRLNALEKLHITEIAAIDGISTLADCESLKSLIIADCRGISEIDLSGGFDKLTHLHIAAPLSNLDITGGLTSDSMLAELTLSDTSELTTLAPFSAVTGLISLEMTDCLNISDLTTIGSYSSLRRLHLESLLSAEKIELPLKSLETVSLTSVHAIDENTFAAGLPNASSISIERCVKVAGIDFLATARPLSHLRLSMMPRITSLSSLKSLNAVRSLELVDCDGLKSLSDIIDLPIEDLTLFALANINDFDMLGNIKTIRNLTIVNCANLIDLSFASSLPDLEKIFLHPLDGTIHVPEPLQPKVTQVPPSSVYYMQTKSWWRRDYLAREQYRASRMYRSRLIRNRAV